MLCSAVKFDQARCGGLGLARAPDLFQSRELKGDKPLLDPELVHDRHHRSLQLTHTVFKHPDSLIVAHRQLLRICL